MGRIMMLVAFLNVILFSNAFAANNPIQKLGRGISNVITAPVEIPREIRAHWIDGSAKTYHIVVWVLCGVIKGTVMTAARIGSGAWDIVSFPVSIPSNNEPLLKPRYVFNDWPKRKAGIVYKNVGDK